MIDVYQPFTIIEGPRTVNFGIVELDGLDYDVESGLIRDISVVIEDMVDALSRSYDDINPTIKSSNYSLVTEIKPIDSALAEDCSETNLNNIGPRLGVAIKNTIKKLEDNNKKNAILTDVANDNMYLYFCEILDEKFNAPDVMDYIKDTENILCSFFNYRKNIISELSDNSLSVKLELPKAPSSFYV